MMKFEDTFEKLTGHEPFPWQTGLASVRWNGRHAFSWQQAGRGAQEQDGCGAGIGDSHIRTYLGSLLRLPRVEAP